MRDGRHLRNAALHPVREAYVRRVVPRRVDGAALVVGAGRSPLPFELARMGLGVRALEPDPVIAAVGQGIADRHRLPVRFERGDPRRLAHADGAFAVAYYADTFETTEDLDGVLAEAARVLAPDGLLVYDTVTRTPLSRLIYLGALQAWRPTRIVPRGRYAPERLRPPHELHDALARHGLQNGDVTPFQPAGPLRLLRAILRGRRGTLGDDEVARLAGMRLAHAGKRPEVTYLGFAMRR
jgi:2-polyprenyl-6-hydroxyphenyl methylase/3-demethylubiquinone-9 3-methyltransferase